MDKRLVLQPVYDDSASRVMGAEIFTRAQSDHKVLRPADFVDTAGDSPYGWRTLDLGSMRLLRGDQALRDHEGMLFVNVTEETLVARGVFRDWLDELGPLVDERQAYGSVVVEIKDFNSLSEPYLANCIRSIREAGAKICSDNFGCRFATTTHLYSFHWDFVKFDWRPANRDDAVWSTITAAADHCYDAGIRAVLLGVESESDLYRARDAGIALLQGYFYGGEL